MMEIRKGFFAPRVSLEYVAFLLMAYVFLPSFVLSVFLLLNVGSPRMAYWLSVGLLVLGGVRYKDDMKFADCLLFLAVVVAAHAVAYSVFDAFHDGFAYHQPAISRIAAGFNPVYDGYMDLGRPADGWSDAATYYPKAFWYFAASVTAALGDIQLGKAYHLILLFSAMCFVFRYSEKNIFKKLLWILACLNPLVLFQFTGYLVDGDVGTLTLVSLFYACGFFSGKPIPRLVHAFAAMTFSLLFCAKTSGFAYGSIVLFFIALHAGAAAYRASGGNGAAGKIRSALKTFAMLGLKVGFPVLALVMVMGYSPYMTNLLSGRHIFYPLIQAFDGNRGEDEAVLRSKTVAATLENEAINVYPQAHNRFTRFALSLFSYITIVHEYPAELKNPLGAPRVEWRQYANAGNARAGGLGPLFPLLLIVSILYQLLLRGRGNGWLLLTLLFLTFIQPHAWQVRFAPFVWLFPFAFLLSTPENKNYLLAIPLFIAACDTCGAGYMAMREKFHTQRAIERELEPYRGRTVLLDKSIFQMDGIFDRYGIKQKFANPDAQFFSNYPWAQAKKERNTGRHPFGSNIAFEEDIPLLPDGRLELAADAAKPWLTMSDGLMLYDPQKASFWETFTDAALSGKGCWNYASKVKLYMRVPDEPGGDMEFLLTAVPNTSEGKFRPQTVAVSVNYRELGVWTFDSAEPVSRSIVVPREILEESFSDDMHLLTLKFDIAYKDASGSPAFSLKFESIEFRRVDR